MKFLFTQIIFDAELARTIVTVFLHSLWQGLTIAFVAWLLMRCIKNSPVLRYNLLAGFLFAFVACVVVTFITQLQHGQGSPAYEGIRISNGTGSAENFFQTIVDWCGANASWIMCSWLVFFLYRVTQLVRGLMAIEKLRKFGIGRSDPYWRQNINELKVKLGIHKKIGFHESNFVHQPLVIGFLKPVILVPIGLLNYLRPAEVEAILLHELAHIKRNDYLVNLFQSFVETVFCFNPFVYWLSEMIRDEREVCCDAISIEHTKDKKIFLEAILSFHEKVPAAPFVMAFMGRKSSLIKRVDRIIKVNATSSTIKEKLALLVSYSLLFILLVSFSLNNKKPKHIQDKKDAITISTTDTIPRKSKEFMDGYKAGQRYSSPSLKSESTVATKKEIELKRADESTVAVQDNKLKKEAAMEGVTGESIPLIQEGGTVKKDAASVVANETIADIQQPSTESATEKKKKETELIKSPAEAVVQEPKGPVTRITTTGEQQAYDRKRIERALVEEKKS